MNTPQDKLNKLSNYRKDKEFASYIEQVNTNDKIDELIQTVKEIPQQEIPEKDIFVKNISDKLNSIEENIKPLDSHKVTFTVSKNGNQAIAIRGKDGKDGERGEKGDKGDKGDKGEKGKDGKNGRDGKDGIDGVDGIDGKDGKDGKDGSSDTPEQIAEKLNSLKEIIDVKSIKGGEKLVDQKRAIEILDQRTQFLLNKPSSTSTGSGDVVGPASAVDNRVATFDGTTGKIIKDSGTLLSSLLTKSNNLADLTSASTARTNLGLGTLATKDEVTEAMQVLADNTTNNVSTSKHGYVPKAENTGLKFLRDDGTWASTRFFVGTLANDVTTGANTNMNDLTNLVWTYEANAIYMFRWIGTVLPAAGTTGCGFALNVSSAVTEISMGFFNQQTGTGISGGASNADDTTIGVSVAMVDATNGTPVTGMGMLRTGANTGTAQMRFRSETTAVTTAKAGLTLVVERVA